MPYIMNALDKTVTVRVFGKHFEFKPKQIKAIVSDDIANKMSTSCGEDGLVGIPEEAMEWDRQGAEWKDLIAKKTIEGKANRLKKLEWIRFNEEVSLKRDLQSKNIQASPFAYGNPELVKAYKELFDLKQQIKNDSASLDFEAQMRELVEKIDGDASSADSGTVDPGSPSVSKTTQAGK